MARPHRQDPERTREQILAIARRDILAGGLSALSLRSIAHEMGYSPGSIYQHFDSKEAIVQTLAIEATAVLRERLAAAPKEEPDEHPVVAMGLAYARTCRQSPDDLTLAGILRTRTSLEQEIPPLSPYKLIVQALADAVDNGELPPGDDDLLEVMAYGVWALVAGIAELHQSHLRGFDADFDAADRVVLRALLRGYATPGES